MRHSSASIPNQPVALGLGKDLRQTGIRVLISDPGARTIPSLDGLRALSIALVFLDHARISRGFPEAMPLAVTNHGMLGVQIFFIISGFLITTLLAEEHSSMKAVSLGLFYARRALRIFPPFYCFLAVVGLATWMGFLDVPLKSFVLAATYTTNYAMGGDYTSVSWVIGHTWSLSVEEQFYIAWPLTIKLVGFRRSYRIAAILAITAPLACLVLYLIRHDLGLNASKYFPFVADSIAAGCVLSGVLPWLRGQKQFFQWFAIPAGDLIVPLILLLDLGRNHPRIHFAVTETVLNLSICYAIVRYTEFPSVFVGRILNNRIPKFIGKLSYSLYLWQEIFTHNSTVLVQAFPINAAATFCCALASYYSVELPMAGMRKRLRPAFFRR